MNEESEARDLPPTLKIDHSVFGTDVAVPIAGYCGATMKPKATARCWSLLRTSSATMLEI